MRPVPSLSKAAARRLDPGTSPAIFQPIAIPGRKPGMPTVSVTRRVHFNAAHRLHNPAYPEEWNARVYGVCANPNYHGHNYELVVKVTGEVDPRTGYVFDMKLLSEIIKKDVVEKFDHKNLNLDVAEFKNMNPTAENIVKVIYDILRKKIDGRYELNLRLYETERNFVEFPA